jgi:hypothetical protein
MQSYGASVVTACEAIYLAFTAIGIDTGGSEKLSLERIE